MFMFDNGIFASFIPQILMVVAYISFLLAPNFKSEKTFNNEIAVNETIVISGQNYNQQFTTHHFDVHNNSTDIVNSSIFIPNYRLVPKILFQFLFYNQFLHHILFGIPPPLYFKKKCIKLSIKHLIGKKKFAIFNTN